MSTGNLTPVAGPIPAIRPAVRPLPLQEQEYRQSLYRIERHAIIPLKWTVLVVTFLLWRFVIGNEVSQASVLLFLLYFLSNAALSYFFYFSTVTINQVRPITLISYLIDVVFVTLLIYLDLRELDINNPLAQTDNHSFYLLYFLLVMRGFALFKTIKETVFVNLLISILYVLTFYLRTTELELLLSPQFTAGLVLIWLVILMGWFIVMIITKQKIELAEVRERLLRADSLVRVGELAAGVAHEINNPIGIIATSAAYLKRSLPEGDERLEEIDMIQSEAMRCKQIVQEMLTYANPRSVGTTLLHPQGINDEVLDFVFPRRREGRFTVERIHQDDVPLMEADPNLLKQALLNLYLNARQAIPDNQPGHIVARIFYNRRQHLITFEIQDNGIGIPPEDVNQIFEPFFTRKARGTGLGLAVTQRIVEKFGGHISVRPAEPQGTIFTLEFPASLT